MPWLWLAVLKCPPLSCIFCGNNDTEFDVGAELPPLLVVGVCCAFVDVVGVWDGAESVVRLMVSDVPDDVCCADCVLVD